jgi:uncharacterized protein YndB with AHSA1/START domain
MKQWWGPKGFTVIASKMDLRPGGIYHYGMRAPDGTAMWGKFVYREIVRPGRMVLVSSFSDEAGGITRHPLAPTWPRETLSTFLFEDEGGRTKLTIKWSPHEADETESATFAGAHESMQQGWTGTLDGLAAYLAKPGSEGRMTDAGLSEPRVVTVDRRLTAVVRVAAPLGKLAEAQRSARATIAAALPALAAGTVGPGCTLWRPPADGVLAMEPGVIVSQVFEAAGEVVPSSLPAGRTVQLLLRGPYDGLPGAWQTLFDWCAGQSLALAGVNWEIYQSGNDAPMIETSLHALLA